MDASQKVTTLPGEVWQKVDFGRPTLHFEYYISNMGRIKSYHKRTTGERLLKGSVDHRGFRRLHIRLADKTYGELALHIFIATHFCEKPSDEFNHAVHVDYDRSNNKWTNIKWLNHDEWREYMQNSPNYKDTRSRKERHYRMSPAKVRLLKSASKRSRLKKRELAEAFAITPMQIYRIERGLNWSHVDPTEEDLETVKDISLEDLKERVRQLDEEKQRRLADED